MNYLFYTDWIFSAAWIDWSGTTVFPQISFFVLRFAFLAGASKRVHSFLTVFFSVFTNFHLKFNLLGTNSLFNLDNVRLSKKN